MGCDIHLYIEKKNEAGAWELHDWEAAFTNGTYDDGSPKRDWSKIFDEPLYIGRNYDLFAILADVRNGRGFAGIDTGDGFEPISEPRGLPDDVTASVKSDSDDWDCDGHSHSWFTLAELQAYDWQQTTKHRGWVDAWNFEVFRKKGKPGGWSGGVSGGNVEHVSNAHLAKMTDSGDLQWTGGEPEEGSYTERGYTTEFTRKMQTVLAGAEEGTIGASVARGKSFYTQVEWEEPYADSCRHFLDQTLPELAKLGEPDSVRIVFWFDN